MDIQTGETRVNLKHLLEDIRDSYVVSVEEAIVSELVANALDSRASRIDFFVAPDSGEFTICDNGEGMGQNVIENYHNIAATTKERGRGIGFAGIGAKLSLLIAKSVITETKKENGSHCATQWHLMSDNRAPWCFIPGPGRVQGSRGTSVTIKLSSSRSSLLSLDFVSEIIRKYFSPLLHSRFVDSVLKNVYGFPIAFFANGERIKPDDFLSEEDSQSFGVFLGKKKKELVGFGCLAKSKEPLSPELSGIGISTYGKVIKRGWDWFGVAPKDRFQIYGIVEVPGLAEILTTNKNDFLKDAASLKKYYKYRKAIQEAIIPILGEIREEEFSFEKNLKRLRPLQKEIEKTLGYVLNNFPELSPLVGVRKRRFIGANNAVFEAEVSGEPPLVEIIQKGQEKSLTNNAETEGGFLKEETQKTQKEISMTGNEESNKSGLRIAFEDNPSQLELARFMENVIWINAAHSGYKRAKKENQEEYHILLCVAWILSRFLEQERSPQDFISRFLASWGYRY